MLVSGVNTTAGKKNGKVFSAFPPLVYAKMKYIYISLLNHYMTFNSYSLGVCEYQYAT